MQMFALTLFKNRGSTMTYQTARLTRQMRKFDRASPTTQPPRFTKLPPPHTLKPKNTPLPHLTVYKLCTTQTAIPLSQRHPEEVSQPIGDPRSSQANRELSQCSESRRGARQHAHDSTGAHQRNANEHAGQHSGHHGAGTKNEGQDRNQRPGGEEEETGQCC